MPPPLRQAARGEGAAAPRVDRGDGVDGALAPHASSSATSKKALGLWEPRSSRPWEGVDEPCLDDVLGRSRRRRGAAQRQPRGGGATCKPKRCVKTKLLVLTNRSKGGRTTTGSGFRTACPEKAGPAWSPVWGARPRAWSTPPCVAAPPPTPDRFSEWLVTARSRVVLPVKHQNYVEGLCPTAGRPALTLFDSVGVGRV